MSFNPRKKLSRCPAMPGVAVGSRLRRVLDVADRPAERAVVRARQHRHFESNLRDPEHRERRRGRCVVALRHALTRMGDQSDWSSLVSIGVLSVRGRPQRGEQLHVVAGGRGGLELKPAPRHQTDEAESQCELFGEQKKPPTGMQLWRSSPEAPDGPCRPRTRSTPRRRPDSLAFQ